MLKQVLTVAVVGLLGAGCASAHATNWDHRYAQPRVAYYPYPHYPHRYAPIRYAPKYCPPQRWDWHKGYYGGYPQYFRDAQRDSYDRHDRDDHRGHDDWDRHH